MNQVWTQFKMVLFLLALQVVYTQSDNYHYNEPGPFESIKLKFN